MIFMDNSLEHHQKLRLYLTFVVAMSHFVLMFLGLVNRLSYTVDTKYTILEVSANSNLWAVFHGIVGAVILWSLWKKCGIVTAMGASTGVMGAWTFLSLLWGLSTLRPVSLAGPLLAGGIATLSYLLTLSWARAVSCKSQGG